MSETSVLDLGGWTIDDVVRIDSSSPLGVPSPDLTPLTAESLPLVDIRVDIPEVFIPILEVDPIVEPETPEVTSVLPDIAGTKELETLEITPGKVSRFLSRSKEIIRTKKRRMAVGVAALVSSGIGISTDTSSDAYTKQDTAPVVYTIPDFLSFAEKPEVNFYSSESSSLVQESIDSARESSDEVTGSDPRTGADFDQQAINEVVERNEQSVNSEPNLPAIDRTINAYKLREIARDEAERAKQEAAAEAERLAQEQLVEDYAEVGEVVKGIYADENIKDGDRIGYIKINGEQVTDRNGTPVFLYKSIGWFQDDPVTGKFVDYIEEGPGMPSDFMVGTVENASVGGHYSTGENPAPFRNLRSVEAGAEILVVFERKTDEGSYGQVASSRFLANEDAYQAAPEEPFVSDQDVPFKTLTLSTCGKIDGVNLGPTSNYRTVVKARLVEARVGNSSQGELQDNPAL